MIQNVIESGQDRALLVRIADFPLWLKSRFVDLQSPNRRSKIAWEHYDLPFDFYWLMLGLTLAYTSGILLPKERHHFSMDTLTTTQRRKFKRVFDQMNLAPGQSVLDIGCGYGELCRYFLSRGIKAYGISNSTGHIAKAKEINEARELIDLYSVMDYQEVQGTYDVIVSIEMIESVGPKHLREFFALCHRLLKPSGRMLIQAIVTDRHDYVGNAFLEKYIFPGAVINNEKNLLASASEYFHCVDVYDMTDSYPHTLECWKRNMQKAYAKGMYSGIVLSNGRSIDKEFIDMFNIYFDMSLVSFTTGRNRVVQYTFIKK